MSGCLKFELRRWPYRLTCPTRWEIGVVGSLRVDTRYKIAVLTCYFPFELVNIGTKFSFLWLQSLKWNCSRTRIALSLFGFILKNQRHKSLYFFLCQLLNVEVSMNSCFVFFVSPFCLLEFGIPLGFNCYYWQLFDLCFHIHPLKLENWHIICIFS